MQGAGAFKDVVQRLYDVAEGQSAAAWNVAEWSAAGRPAQPGMGFAGRNDEQVVGFIAATNESVDHLDRERTTR